MSTLKELRTEKNLTQRQAADILGVSIRSYISYENDPGKEGTLKYDYMLQKLQSINVIDEEHGILDIAAIKKKTGAILSDYPVKYCILFGSYAKGTASEDSDIDMLISSSVKGLEFFGMVEKLRDSMHKKVDVLDLSQLKNNLELTDEILKDGVKIYG